MAFFDNLNKFKILELTLTNVAITSKGTSTPYYYESEKINTFEPGYKTAISIVLTNFEGAKASFVPYINGGKICFMSDVSQTISSVKVRIVYL